MKSADHKRITLNGRTINYRVVRSAAARRVRIRVGLNGVEVLHPTSRCAGDAADFLRVNGDWVTKQLDRIERLRGIRQPQRRRGGEILFRGHPTPVRVERRASHGSNKITFDGKEIFVERGTRSGTPLARSLENWLRKQARGEIERLLNSVTGRLRQSPRKVYVMGQRTKWGNCSAKRNLSFNWRLVLGPEFVLRYFVTHEVVHLAVPDHSPRFWLAVQSICPEMQKAKQWLQANGHRLLEDLRKVCERKEG